MPIALPKSSSKLAQNCQTSQHNAEDFEKSCRNLYLCTQSSEGSLGPLFMFIALFSPKDRIYQLTDW